MNGMPVIQNYHARSGNSRRNRPGGPVGLTLFLQCTDVFGDELNFEK